MRVKMTKKQQKAFVEFLKAFLEIATPKEKERIRKEWLKNRDAK